MAQLGSDFDHGSVEKGQDFDLLPSGEYTAQIVDSDIVPTKAGTGKIAKITLQIMEGSFENRKVWDNVNFINPNPQAQTIGQQRLKAYCEAAGVAGHLSDTEELHLRPMRIRIGLSKPQDGYDQKNEIKAVKPLNGSAPPAGKSVPQQRSSAPRQTAPQRSSAPPPKQPGSRPWGDRAA